MILRHWLRTASIITKLYISHNCKACMFFETEEYFSNCLSFTKYRACPQILPVVLFHSVPFHFVIPVCFYSLSSYLHDSVIIIIITCFINIFMCRLCTVQKVFFWLGLLSPWSLRLRSCLLPRSEVSLWLPRRRMSTCRRQRPSRYRFWDVLALSAVYEQPRLWPRQHLHDALQPRIPSLSVQSVDWQQLVLLETCAGIKTSDAATNWSWVSQRQMEGRLYWTESRGVGAELQVLDVGDANENQRDIEFHVRTSKFAQHCAADLHRELSMLLSILTDGRHFKFHKMYRFSFITKLWENKNMFLFIWTIIAFDVSLAIV